MEKKTRNRTTKINLLKKYEKELGKKIGTWVLNRGQKSISVMVFKEGFRIKKAKRGEILIDFRDFNYLIEIVANYVNKQKIINSIK